MDHIDFAQFTNATCCEACGRPFPQTRHKDDVELSLRTIHRGENKVRITPREHLLFDILLRGYPEILTREYIFGSVWGNDSDIDDKILDVIVCGLNKKLAAIELRIKNSRGVGYNLAKVDVDRQAI